jgi:hypothetical protein
MEKARCICIGLFALEFLSFAKGVCMPHVSSSFDLQSVEWRRITEPKSSGVLVDFEYSLLGYDLASNRLDMLLRYGPQAHCRRHRHVASTATLVLEGEQLLEEMLPNGTIRMIHRRKGTYALAPADAYPHDEYGGPDGGTVLLSMTAAMDGVLFEYFDENMANPWTVSIEQYVESWATGISYGLGPNPTSLASKQNLNVAAAPEMSTAQAQLLGSRLDVSDSILTKANFTNDELRANHVDESSNNGNNGNGNVLGDGDRDSEGDRDGVTVHESQEVAADGRMLELGSIHSTGLVGMSSQRYSESRDREKRRNWKFGIALATLIAVMLFVAGHLIWEAYTKTLPPSDKSYGDLTRPSLR